MAMGAPWLALAALVLVGCAGRVNGAKGAKAAKVGMACDEWTGPLCKQLATGEMQLVVTADGGGAMQIPTHFITGQFSMDMRLPQGNSGGTSTTFYVMDSITPSNKDPRHSEIDIEFMGNKTGAGIMMATNVFCGGKQNLAQFRLPFDPSAAYHKYSIRWNAREIVWLVDGTPLRILKRSPKGPWPTLAMKPQSSIWATPWSVLKADFSKGPIKASTRNFQAQGCPALKTQASIKPLQCKGPWNGALSKPQLAAYARLHSAALLSDYGWDKA